MESSRRHGRHRVRPRKSSRLVSLRHELPNRLEPFPRRLLRHRSLKHSKRRLRRRNRVSGGSTDQPIVAVVGLPLGSARISHRLSDTLTLCLMIPSVCLGKTSPRHFSVSETPWKPTAHSSRSRPEPKSRSSIGPPKLSISVFLKGSGREPRVGLHRWVSTRTDQPVTQSAQTLSQHASGSLPIKLLQLSEHQFVDDITLLDRRRNPSRIVTGQFPAPRFGRNSKRSESFMVIPAFLLRLVSTHTRDAHQVVFGNTDRWGGRSAAKFQREYAFEYELNPEALGRSRPKTRYPIGSFRHESARRIAPIGRPSSRLQICNFRRAS